MHYRTITKSGIKLSEVGMGCNRLGGKEQPDSHWISLIQHSADLGVNIYDTAEGYQHGRSEEMLGAALGNRDDVYIATKVGRGKNGPDFTFERISLHVEASLKRLQRTHIDFLQLHSPSRQELEQYDWAESMVKLQTQGKIRFCAMAINTVEDAIWLIKQGLVDLVQITYNIFEPEAENELFAVAEQFGVGLMGRLTLAQGVLTGKFRPGKPVASDHRVNMSGEERLNKRIEMVEDLRPIGESYEGGLTRMAHQFSLSSPAITTIIPGARTIQQLEENVAASNGMGLAEGVREKIEAIRPSWGEWQGGYWAGGKKK
ncbi:MAG: aryl-alcohol dehydrogenase-like predicted oxidoreductase [Cellvibrionaceae bacterium]|jgi:aryl-alcohol dehydrogenase-like predicted oxidoreductase